MIRYIEKLKAGSLEAVEFAGGAGLLMSQVFKETRLRQFASPLMADQIFQIGVRSMPLIFITVLSIGSVMALQFGLGLEKFGGKLYVPKITSLSIIKELGPVFTALMLTARIGAGMASEIGSMTVTQQIDAIRALGTSPVEKIVIPRFFAILLVLPLLTVMANSIGILGGLIVGATELGLDANYYFQKVVTTVKLNEYLEGLTKTVFFAAFIGISSCYYGLNVKEGTRGVGIATTKAVVTSSILIVVSDFFLTKLFWVLARWT